jgi:hypothetical protein
MGVADPGARFPQKKTPEPDGPEDCTLMNLHPSSRAGKIRTALGSVQAGLLTHGSTYSPRLPGFPVAYVDFVPVHSGGTAPDSHGIPH